LLNGAVDVTTLFGVTDADNDTITQYQFYDGTAGNGHFAVNGVERGVIKTSMSAQPILPMLSS